jgi:cyclopropane fatty-acyl-phospholipid synthase-like methyltransferase
MNSRAMTDAREAVGGLWDDMGALQLNLLQEHGLTPSSTVLDIGCGSLRGGRKVIACLDAGNYWGTEIAERLLDAGRGYLEQEGLSHKVPHLLHVRDFKFQELAGQKFDFVLIFGVFTDVPPNAVRECFSGLPGLMHAKSVGLATFGLSDQIKSDFRAIRFRQPFAFYEELAQMHGLDVELVRDFSFRHPKAHSLLRFRPVAAD